MLMLLFQACGSRAPLVSMLVEETRTGPPAYDWSMSGAKSPICTVFRSSNGERFVTIMADDSESDQQNTVPLQFQKNDTWCIAPEALRGLSSVAACYLPEYRRIDATRLVPCR